MASCFLCGSIEESEAWFDGKEFFNTLIFDFIKKNDIRTIYTLSRNLFDDIIEDTVNEIKDDHNAELVKVIYDKSPSASLSVRLSAFRWNGKTVCPINEETDPMITYRTLYKWMIDNSDYMLTYCTDDGDITEKVLKTAQKEGLKIYNLAEHITYSNSHMHENIIQLKRCTD